MALQFLDLVMAACAALGQILGGVDAGSPAMPPAVGSHLETQSTYPNERPEALLNKSEKMHMQAEWRRFWMNGQPAHMSYQRVDAGIGP
jgi:hypothetical protein